MLLYEFKYNLNHLCNILYINSTRSESCELSISLGISLLLLCLAFLGENNFYVLLFFFWQRNRIELVFFIWSPYFSRWIIGQSWPLCNTSAFFAKKTKVSSFITLPSTIYKWLYLCPIYGIFFHQNLSTALCANTTPKSFD